MLSVAYSPDGKRLACGSMDGTVCIFDSITGALLHCLEGHYKPVRSLTFNPGRYSCSSTCGNSLSYVVELMGSAVHCHASLYSADSHMLVTACDDMHAHLYDVENGSLIEAFSGNLPLPLRMLQMGWSCASSFRYFRC